MTISEHLAALMQAEMVPSGMLPLAKKVMEGSCETPSVDDMPLITVEGGSGSGTADVGNIKLSHDILIMIYFINTTRKDEEALRNQFIIDVPNQRGMLLFLLKNRHIKVDDVDYEIKIGEFSWNVPEKAKTAAAFPLVVETMFRYSPDP